LAGLLIREAFSFWTGHPFDFEIWVRAGYWVAHGHSPYAAMPFAPGVSFANDFGGANSGLAAAVGYLPVWPLLVGGLYELYALLGAPTPYLYYFLIKQPIIICDVLTAYYLYRYTQRRGSGKASFVIKFWLFSPLMIIISSIWGMFDAIPVLFVVLALSARPGAYRGMWAGIATFAKSVPLIYTIPLSSGPKPLRNLAIALVIPVGATALIVWLAGWSILGQGGVGTTLGSTLSSARGSLSLWAIAYYLNSNSMISTSAAAYLSQPAGYLWIVAVPAATILAYKWFGFKTERGVVQSILLITLTFLLLRGQVNEQYSLYLFAPALIDVAMWSPQRRNLVVASMVTVLAFHVTNVVLLIRYASPVFHNALSVEASIIAEINPERNALLFLEALLFCALNIYYFYALSKERGVRTEDSVLSP
jgi:Gpi18-like mannosyltransferase